MNHAALTAEEIAIREELTRIQLARLRLPHFATYCQPWYRVYRHHAYLMEKLEQVERFVRTGGREGIGRLIINMPPQHGKSVMSSMIFPAWFLGRNPDARVVIASYGAFLAEYFSRQVRSLLQGTEFQKVFGALSAQDAVPEQVQLDPDGRSAQSWEILGHRGGLVAAGVGGGLSGRSSELLIIDDPIKDDEEAQSEVIRQKVIDWFTSVAYLRLQKDGAVVVIQCMAGDTPVLMADGTEKALSEVRPGDEVATYDDGEVSVSRVLNWTNHGPDSVFAIKMSSGRAVKANERHPFLVERNNKLLWVKLRNLKIGDVILRVTGESGAELPAPVTDVCCQRRRKGSARRTTTSGAGPMVCARLRSILARVVRPICDTATASASPSTRPCSKRRAVAVRSAASLLARMCGRTGSGSSASITATRPARCEDCCATTATSPSDMGRQKPPCSQPLSTYAITRDTIVSIEPAGQEDVFDLQVERTENFIANGMVSHNTRWHEADLSGWLMEKEPEKWELVRLPAIAEPDDPLKRPEGDPLWPEERPLSFLEERRALLPSRHWNALYQQSPTGEEGEVFNSSWFVYGDFPRKEDISYGVQVWDTALTEKEDGDYSACVTAYVTRDGVFIADAFRARLNFPALKARMYDLYAQWSRFFRISRIGIENRVSGTSLLQSLKKGSHLPVIPMEPESKLGKSKRLRAESVAGYVQAGRVVFRKGAPWLKDLENELIKFPSGKHDDLVDALVYALILVQGGGKPPRGNLAEARERYHTTIRPDRLSLLMGG